MASWMPITERASRAVADIAWRYKRTLGCLARPAKA